MRMISGGRKPPEIVSRILIIIKPMNVSEIIDAISSEIVARNCFIVDVTISKDNDVEITIESENGCVELDDCVSVSRFFETKFDREKEDYSLTVTSAGLDQPFKVFKQYQKAVGSKVEVQLKGGRKLIATLSEADEESITLRYSAKEAVEGKKKKELVEHNDRFTMDQVNSVRPHIEF
ncbi:MAG: ribosome assembly cofactor RimP [Bacteroidales bacterium]|nr:ribosome assembly cofactor RimP [Bacteroidales bacterium]